MQRLAEVELALPIGSIVDFSVELTTTNAGKAKALKVIVAPFLMPLGDVGRPGDGAGQRNPAGFDREWDLLTGSEVDVPDEEAALLYLEI